MKAALIIGIVLMVSPVLVFGQTREVMYSFTDPGSTHTTFDTFIGWSGSSFTGSTWDNSEIKDTGSTNALGSEFNLGFGTSYLNKTGLVLSDDLMFSAGQLGGATAPSSYTYRYFSVDGFKLTLNLAVGYHWIQNESGDLRVSAGYFFSESFLTSPKKSSNGSSWSAVLDTYGSAVSSDFNLSHGISVGARYDFRIDDANAVGLEIRDLISLGSYNYYNADLTYFDFYKNLQVNQLEINLVWSNISFPRKVY